MINLWTSQEEERSRLAKRKRRTDTIETFAESLEFVSFFVIESVTSSYSGTGSGGASLLSSSVYLPHLSDKSILILVAAVDGHPIKIIIFPR